MTLEQKIERLEHTVMGWDIYLKNIQSNQKFYLEKRMPIRNKRDSAYHAAIQKVEALSQFLSTLDIAHVKKNYGKLSLFVCTRNQARKLRALAEEDLRVGHAWKEIKDKGEK